ncbi:MAG: hypothetical protein JOZ78_16210 [Chroococcidiopsidaceae cyanobacterium CP_BM_ER_R8_30]|nr:hypothetical protein [Chroococcidiopsidaceae cyanobacterium CP_BM_ER_R8_30]
MEVRAQDQDYFDEAESGGHVYGTSRLYVKGKMRTFYVFAWLGEEVNYQSRSKDDPKTSYKKFINCTVRIALTQEQLDSGTSTEESGLSIILYY